MDDMQILREMLDDEAKVQIIEGYNHDQVILEEPKEANSTVIIKGLPKNSIVIKADKFKSPDTIFSGTKGECKRADFIIVSNINNNTTILFIEMKSKKKSCSETEIIQQLTGAYCFIEYCKSIGVEFWKKTDFLTKYSKRFILLYKIGVPKTRTRIRPSKNIHNCPKNMLKISSPNHLQYNRLIDFKQ